MVDSLREEWEGLSQLAERVRLRLLHEQRHIHEREVERQVRAFHVETIQFRNSFDTEGPLVPGLAPEVAMERLGMEDCVSLPLYLLSSQSHSASPFLLPSLPLSLPLSLPPSLPADPNRPPQKTRHPNHTKYL